ncbi:helix-turn-helix domain-containing protein [Actinomadura meridiana]|uniref:helix-turn-helix domain-containing protein n=1 Tax=Actinomadura meridiana TaxID=559626 RepID=UPI003CD072CF
MARMFGVSVVTVTRWADEGKLVFVRTPGGRRRYSLQQVEYLMLAPSSPRCREGDVRRWKT